jgi:hypothetical protein
LLLEKHKEANTETYNSVIGEEVIKLLEISLLHNSGNAVSLYHIGEIYTLLGDFARGLEYMEEAYRVDEINFDVQLGLMQSYLLNKRYSDCEKLERSLSRLYRKLKIPARFTALINYLYISAEMAQDKKAKKETKELEKLLDEKVVIDSWYYEPYLAWLQACECPEETRNYLMELTAKMQERKLN